MVAKKFWAMLVVVLLLFGITGMVFGADKTAPKALEGFQRDPGAPPAGSVEMVGEFGKALDELIAVKAITPEQKGKIIEYFERARKEAKPMDQKAMAEPPKEGNDPISLLVKDAVINQAQAAVIKRVAPRHFPRLREMPNPPDPEKMKADLQKKLDGLVESKAITVKQKDIILKFFIDKFSNGPSKKHIEKFEKDKGMKDKSNDFFVLLVQCGVITQKQADAMGAISEVMPKPMTIERRFGVPHLLTSPDPEKMKAELEGKLDELISSNVITDKQKDNIIKYFEDDFNMMKGPKPDRRFEKDDVPMDAPRDPLGRLVKDEVITAEQADIIRKAILRPLPAEGDSAPKYPQPK